MTSDPKAVQLWRGRARARYPKQAALYTDEQIERSMAGWLGLMEPLGFAEHEDQTRYLLLCVLLSPEQKQSNLVQGVLRRVLSHTDWEPDQRLEFLYRHIVERPVSPDEEDFGPDFVPSAVPPSVRG